MVLFVYWVSDKDNKVLYYIYLHVNKDFLTLSVAEAVKKVFDDLLECHSWVCHSFNSNGVVCI